MIGRLFVISISLILLANSEKFARNNQRNFDELSNGGVRIEELHEQNQFNGNLDRNQPFDGRPFDNQPHNNEPFDNHPYETNDNEPFDNNPNDPNDNNSSSQLQTMPIFLQQSNQQARDEFLRITHDEHLTKSQTEQKQDEWSKKQGNEIQKQYQSFKESINRQHEEYTKKLKEKSASLNAEARTVFNRIQDVLQNKQIMHNDEFNQIEQIIQKASKEAQDELRQKMPIIGQVPTLHLQPIQNLPQYSNSPTNGYGQGISSPVEGKPILVTSDGKILPV